MGQGEGRRWIERRAGGGERGSRRYSDIGYTNGNAVPGVHSPRQFFAIAGVFVSSQSHPVRFLQSFRFHRPYPLSAVIPIHRRQIERADRTDFEMRPGRSAPPTCVYARARPPPHDYSNEEFTVSPGFNRKFPGFLGAAFLLFAY